MDRIHKLCPPIWRDWRGICEGFEWGGERGERAAAGSEVWARKNEGLGARRHHLTAEMVPPDDLAVPYKSLPP